MILRILMFINQAANTDLEKALKLSPKDPLVLYKVGLNCYASNKYVKAIRV